MLRQQPQLARHPNVIPIGKVVGNQSALQLVPMDMLNHEVLPSRWHAEQEPPIHPCRARATMRAAHTAAHDDIVPLCHHVDDFHLPVREGGKDVFEIASQRRPALDDALLAVPPGTEMVTDIRCKQLRRLLPLARVDKRQMSADDPWL
jgi:hypothetical protein